MVDVLGNVGELNLFFHHNNTELFKQLLDTAKGNYTSYIIMPSGIDNVDEYINVLPVKSVYILDRTTPQLTSKYPFVCVKISKRTCLTYFKKNTLIIRKYKHIRFINSNKDLHILDIEKRG